MYGRRCDKHNERYDMCECFGRVFCWLRVYCHALRYEIITAATKLKQSNGHASEQTNVESHSFWSRERGRVGRANRNVCLHRNRFETERYWSISHTVFCLTHSHMHKLFVGNFNGTKIAIRSSHSHYCTLTVAAMLLLVLLPKLSHIFSISAFFFALFRFGCARHIVIINRVRCTNMTAIEWYTKAMWVNLNVKGAKVKAKHTRTNL